LSDLTVARAMQVLHVIPGVAPRYGGPSTAIWPLVSALNQLPGIRAEIATTDADGAKRRLSRSDLPGDVAVHLFRRDWSEQWKVSLAMRSWLRRNANHFDLIHIHGVWAFATMAAARAAERNDIPYIVRPAGMLSAYSLRHRGWKKRIYWQLMEGRTFNRACGLHVTSDQEAAEVRSLRPNARVFVIPNGVDEAAFSCKRMTTLNGVPPLCRKLALDKPVVLFLSRLHPKKGIVDRLLPAFAAMQTAALLTIVGEEDNRAPGYKNEIRRAVERLGLERRVSLREAVYGDDRWALFDAADVFVLPSHSENFGIVVGEAMALACPVVVTDSVQSCSHVVAANAGEVVSGNPSALAEALDRVLSSPKQKQAFGESGRAYAEQHFRWGRIAHEVRKMYDDCLATSDSTDVRK
jgi:glycosyltransferase involved in cell wall biosynthesis